MKLCYSKLKQRNRVSTFPLVEAYHGQHVRMYAFSSMVVAGREC